MDEKYKGFELGPIRPPSEAQSLLLRVTRNCPWNKCKFCGLYKGEKFSIRPVDHVIRDIDTVRRYVDEIDQIMQRSGGAQKELIALQEGKPGSERMALHAASIAFTPPGETRLVVVGGRKIPAEFRRLLDSDAPDVPGGSSLVL